MSQIMCQQKQVNKVLFKNSQRKAAESEKTYVIMYIPIQF